ncbi:hypothetical protein MPTK1_3g17545 [Marchantia polymorpha subsp. ruderalis]
METMRRSYSGKGYGEARRLERRNAMKNIIYDLRSLEARRTLDSDTSFHDESESSSLSRKNWSLDDSRVLGNSCQEKMTARCMHLGIPGPAYLGISQDDWAAAKWHASGGASAGDSTLSVTREDPSEFIERRKIEESRTTEFEGGKYSALDERSHTAHSFPVPTQQNSEVEAAAPTSSDPEASSFTFPVPTLQIQGPRSEPVQDSDIAETRTPRIVVSLWESTSTLTWSSSTDGNPGSIREVVGYAGAEKLQEQRSFKMKQD